MFLKRFLPCPVFNAKAGIFLYVQLFYTLLACRQPLLVNAMKDRGISYDYTLVKGWPQLAAGYTIGPAVGIGIDSKAAYFYF